MTRDEAIRIAHQASDDSPTGERVLWTDAIRQVDALVALGVLKLDKPLVTVPDNDPYDQWITIMGPNMSYPAFVPVESAIKALRKKGYALVVR